MWGFNSIPKSGKGIYSKYTATKVVKCYIWLLRAKRETNHCYKECRLEKICKKIFIPIHADIIINNHHKMKLCFRRRRLINFLQLRFLNIQSVTYFKSKEMWTMPMIVFTALSQTVCSLKYFVRAMVYLLKSHRKVINIILQSYFWDV